MITPAADNSRQLLTLGRASALIAEWTGGARRPAITSLWRWARKGLRGVRLNYLRCGKSILVSRADLEKFMRDLAQADATAEPWETPGSPVAVTRVVTPSQRTRERDRTRRGLVAAGIVDADPGAGRVLGDGR